MLERIPGFHDYVRDPDGKALGRCAACGYEGPMKSGMTGYECSKCKSSKLELELKDGQSYRQWMVAPR